MNEKILCRLCAISVVACVFFAGFSGILGKNLCDNRDTIKQFQTDYTNAKNRIVCITEGLNRISEESGRRREIINDLQTSIRRLRESTENLKEANNRLRIANQKLEKLRADLESRNRILEEASNRIRENFEKLERLFSEIEENPVD